jgi:signal transduction histidine kinase/DNA-binding NarL/FixJ family response regulator
MIEKGQRVMAVAHDGCPVISPATCTHQVQFYDEEDHLHSVLSNYFAPFLDDGEDWLGAIVLARAPTRKYLEDCLLDRDYTRDGLNISGEWARTGGDGALPLSTACIRGQRRVFLVDGDKLLAQLVSGSELDMVEFDTVLHELLSQLMPASSADLQRLELPIYAYGELVDILCARGQHLLALELESCWNRLLATRNIWLLCGYKMGSFCGLEADCVFDQICHSHTTVTPTEMYSKLSTTQEQLALIAALQQKAMKLYSKEPLNRSDSKAEQQIRYREQFIATICHELRNPVAGLVGNVELLQEGLDLRQAILNPHRADLREDVFSISNSDVASLRYQLAGDMISVDAIAVCAEQMKTVSDDVLSLSKLEEGKVVLEKVQFDPKITIASVIKIFSTIAQKKGVSIFEDLPAERFLVVGDPGRLAQVITNLISNAIKFTQSGSITVQLRPLGTLPGNHGCLSFKVTVRDTGRGLSRQDISLLFQRFAQPPSASFGRDGGTGLGLYISKYLVELMGGVMYVESQIGVGSTFTFTFQVEKCPVAEDDMTRRLSDRECTDDRRYTADSNNSSHLTRKSSLSGVSLPRRPPISRSVSDGSGLSSYALPLMSPTSIVSNGTPTGQPHQRVRHVLVVDDNPIILRTFTRILESATSLSLSVSTASNGYEAISKLIALYSSNSPVDMVLMDLDMPFMNGLKAADEIRRLADYNYNKGKSTEVRQLADTLIIGLTGDMREDRFAEARRHGMDECIMKPVVRATLLELMERVALRRQNGASPISGHA